MSQFDSLIIGEVAQDTNVDYDGTTVHASALILPMILANKPFVIFA